MNTPYSDGSTALTKAAENGHDHCITTLIQTGADVNKKKPQFCSDLRSEKRTDTRTV